MSGEGIKGGTEAGNPRGDLKLGGQVSSHPQEAGDSPAGDGDTQLDCDETKGCFCSPGLSAGRQESHDQEAVHELGTRHGLSSQSQRGDVTEKHQSTAAFPHLKGSP